jgi:hypothetical protein
VAIDQRAIPRACLPQITRRDRGWWLQSIAAGVVSERAPSDLIERNRQQKNWHGNRINGFFGGEQETGLDCAREYSRQRCAPILDRAINDGQTYEALTVAIPMASNMFLQDAIAAYL